MYHLLFVDQLNNKIFLIEQSRHPTRDIYGTDAREAAATAVHIVDHSGYGWQLHLCRYLH